MPKELFFDLHFTDAEVTAISARGLGFLQLAESQGLARSAIYRLATNLGLHVRFENTAIRDVVTAT